MKLYFSRFINFSPCKKLLNGVVSFSLSPGFFFTEEERVIRFHEMFLTAIIIESHGKRYVIGENTEGLTVSSPSDLLGIHPVSATIAEII
jgi:hypothetical protein